LWTELISLKAETSDGCLWAWWRNLSFHIYKMIMELQSSTGCREFLTSWLAVSFWRRTVLHAVSQLEWIYSTSISKLHGWVMEYVSFPVVFIIMMLKVRICKSTNDSTHIDDPNLFYWRNFLTEYVIENSLCNYTLWGFINCVSRLIIVKNVDGRVLLTSCLIVCDDFLMRFRIVYVPEMGTDRSTEILLLICCG
jgi:hypothetical protein